MLVPILFPSIDWNQHLLFSRRILGFNINQLADDYKLEPNTAEAFIVSLGSILNRDAVPGEILADNNFLLRHLHYGFLTVLDSETLAKIKDISRLNTIAIETKDSKLLRLVFISGNLEDWRNSIIDGSSSLSSSFTRVFFTEAYTYFKSIGLSKLWDDYSIRHQQDNNILLLERK